MRLSVHFDAFKKTHAIHVHLASQDSDTFYFTDNEDADVIIVALDGSMPQIQRAHNYLTRGKKVLVYIEHISALVEAPASTYEFPNFLGCVSHARSSVIESRKYLPNYKHFYLPVGMPVQDRTKIEERLTSDHPITLLFWGSWVDYPHGNFYGRGGLAADEIFGKVREKISNVKFIIRVPNHISLTSDRFPESMYRTSVYVPQEELDNIHERSDIYLLPSQQAHFATVPAAMSYGMPVVGNHNWGYDEHIIDGHNGIREQYNTPGEQCMNRACIDKNYVNLVSERLIDLITNREKLITMSRNALETQLEEHNIAHYPKLLAKILADALPD